MQGEREGERDGTECAEESKVGMVDGLWQREAKIVGLISGA